MQTGETSLVALAARPRRTGEAGDDLVACALVALRFARLSGDLPRPSATWNETGAGLAGFTFATSPHVLRSHGSSFRPVS